jgi:ribonucleotide reductase alpha subunit
MDKNYLKGLVKLALIETSVNGAKCGVGDFLHFGDKVSVQITVWVILM